MRDHARRVAALFDLVADDYDQHVPFFTAFADELVPRLGIGAGDTVLDVGSGRGALAIGVRRAGAFVVAADISLGMLRHNPAARVCLDASTLPFPDSTFDCVMGAFSFHLLPDPAGGLGEAIRTLRRGGMLGVAVPGAPPAPGSAGDLVMQTLLRYPRRDAPALLPPPVPFDPLACMRALGMEDVSAEEISLQLPVPDAATYLRGERSHGFRSLFESIEPSARADLDAELHELLEGLRADGLLVQDRSARFVTGRRC